MIKIPKFSYPKAPENKGIALLVALGTMILILIIGSLAVYLVIRALNVTAGQKRYQTAFEACEGGLELGVLNAHKNFEAHNIVDTTFLQNIGNYRVHVYVRPLFAATEAGAVIKFARGYFGAGQGLATGGASYYYKILAASCGPAGDSVTTETEIKRVIGID
ncbi:MAG: pilus assembly PilX N-terminal domain-containing protein [candidate division WOR-3 bacterium]